MTRRRFDTAEPARDGYAEVAIHAIPMT